MFYPGWLSLKTLLFNEIFLEMRTNIDFLVSFFIRKRKNNPKVSSVYVRIIVNSVYRDVGLKKAITTSSWDTKVNRAKGYSGESRILNTYLDKTSTKIYKHYDTLIDEGVFITATKWRWLALEK